MWIQIQMQIQKYKDNDKDKHTDKVSEKKQHMLYFWNPDDLLIPNMMIDTSPWSSCSRRSPWLLCSGHKISSTGPSVSPFRDFLIFMKYLWQRICLYSNFISSKASHDEVTQFPNGRKIHVCTLYLPTEEKGKIWIHKYLFLKLKSISSRPLIKKKTLKKGEEERERRVRHSGQVEEFHQCLQ